MPYKSEPGIDPVWRENTLRQVGPWLRECLKHHKDCRYRGYGKGLPTRVIDVGPPDGSRDPFLFVPERPVATKQDQMQKFNQSHDRESWQHFRKEEGAAAEVRYLALSYCWGNKQNFVTKLGNLDSLKESIPWREIPQTVRDAISITRGLGIRYLWIDALCIVQDSPEDWSAESVKMAEVYGGAFLTLSAAHGADVHDGLLRQADPGKHKFPLQEDPLYSRAWGLQERMLSSRILIFGSDQMYWECHQKQEGEDGQKLSKIISYRMPSKPLYKDWHMIVQDYSSRCLTYETDKLPAISGLAEVYREATNYTYIAGLWRETLLRDLLWKQQWLLYGNQVITCAPFQYRAPSWSWASIDGNVNYLSFRTEKPFLERTQVMGTCIDATPSVDGAPVGDWICLRGPLLGGKIKKDKLWFRGGGCCVPWPDVEETEEESSWDGSAQNIPKEIPDKNNVWSLLIGTMASNDGYVEGYGLVLVQCDDVGDNVFRRVGFFITVVPKGEKPLWKSRFEECEDSVIFII